LVNYYSNAGLSPAHSYDLITTDVCKSLVLLVGLMICTKSLAGAYIFADEVNGVDIITHPNAYLGSGGNIIVRVCIEPASVNATDMEIPVQNNINIYNELQVTTENLSQGGSNNIPPSQIDFESVALHEIGHCLGMAHANLASESGQTGNNQNYTRTTDGADNAFNLNSGVDGVIGSSDDNRGDDINLHWYRISNNNPFTIDSPVDSSTYSRDPANLPTGHNFAANADRTVAGILGVPNSEAVMQQQTFFDEAQRTLGHDDVATLLLAASGLNELAGNSDDYTITLEYGGISATNCDVNLSMTPTASLAFCSVGGTTVNNQPQNQNHIRVTTPSIEFGQGFSWFFNQQSNADIDTDGDGLTDNFEIDVLGTDPNNIDSDGDGLVDGADGVVPIGSFPSGIDSNGDGFVDGEQDLGTDPNLADSDGDQLPDGLEVANNSDPLDAGSWPNLADGDLAPYGNPDGIINVADYLIAQQIVTLQIAANPLELAHGDLYPPGAPDGVIDISDLILIVPTILD